MACTLNKNILSQVQEVIQIKSLVELKAGFSQPKWILNDEYILKVWNKNQSRFYEKEHLMLNLLNGKHEKVPSIKHSNFPFIVMSRLPGTPLNSIWDSLDNKEKESLVEQICKYVRNFSQLDYSNHHKHFPQINNWHTWVKKQFQTNLFNAQTLNLIDKKTAKEYTDLFNSLEFSLSESNMGIMYYDIHFGNFLVQDGEISGIVDFERVEWVSIDYCLNWINRMNKFNQEYNLSNKDDMIFNLFQKYYPEMFAFKNLEERLAVYELISNLRIMINKNI